MILQPVIIPMSGHSRREAADAAVVLLPELPDS